VLVLSGAFASACAQTGRDTRSAAAESLEGSRLHGYIRGDTDGDGDGYDDEDDRVIVGYGQKADAADEGAVALVVTRYMTAAAARDGRSACRLLYTGIDKVTSLADSVPLPWTPGPASPMRRVRSCARALTILLREDHTKIDAEEASLKVTGVRASGSHGLAMLTFKTVPERYLPVVREGSVWKIASPLDLKLP